MNQKRFSLKLFVFQGLETLDLPTIQKIEGPPLALVSSNLGRDKEKESQYWQIFYFIGESKKLYKLL